MTKRNLTLKETIEQVIYDCELLLTAVRRGENSYIERLARATAKEAVRLLSAHRDTEIKRISQWIRIDDQLADLIDKEDLTFQDLLNEAGGLLDEACSHEITGQCVFKADDERYYVGSVQFVISEANPDYVNDLIHEVPDCGEIVENLSVQGDVASEYRYRDEDGQLWDVETHQDEPLQASQYDGMAEEPEFEDPKIINQNNKNSWPRFSANFSRALKIYRQKQD